MISTTKTRQNFKECSKLLRKARKRYIALWYDRIFHLKSPDNRNEVINALGRKLIEKGLYYKPAGYNPEKPASYKPARWGAMSYLFKIYQARNPQGKNYLKWWLFCEKVGWVPYTASFIKPYGRARKN